MTRYLHTMYRITDPERSRAFYEALGLKLRRESPIVRNGELEATNYFFGVPGQDEELELTFNHDGRTYDVTGPEALSLDAAAAIVSEAAGREVVYERETLEQARESRRPSGAPDWEIEGWVTSYAALDAGALERPSDTVQEILGRPPRSLADVLREHPERLDHLR